MRILVVTQDFPPRTGGIQSYMGRLCEHLRPLCEHLAVVAPGSDAERATDSGRSFPVRRVGIHSSWLALPLMARLPEIVRTEQATHVLYAQWFPATAGMRLPSRIKQASIVHGRELLNHPLGKAGLALSGPVLRHLDAIIPNSRATAALLPDGIRPERIRIVHPGVDSRKLSPPSADDTARFFAKSNLAPDTPVVTTLARLVPRKGVDTLIAAMDILKSRIPDVRLLIGGSGPDLARLKSLVDESGLAEHVRFMGRVPDEDMNAFLAAGVFALLSRQTRKDVEGFGMVLAEAQACQAPVVAARSGGMPEAVGPGAGIVVDPDAPDQAAEAIASLLANAARRQEMGAKGRAFAKSLSWESRAETIASILRSLT